MARSSYDELIKQVESLKAENRSLRQELEDNSSHLTKLEYEAGNMKDALSHLDINLPAYNPPYQNNEADQNLNSYLNCVDNINDERNVYNRIDLSRMDINSNDESQTSWKSPKNAILIQQLLSDRSRISLAIGAEEKEKRLCYNHLEIIKNQLEKLPNLENDEITKVHLQREQILIRNRIYEKFGTESEMVRRDESRLRHVKIIDQEISKLWNQESNESSSDEGKSSNSQKKGSLEPEQNQTSHRSDSSISNGFLASELNGPDDSMSIRNSRMTNSGTQTASSFNDSNSNISTVYHGTWPVDRVLCHSGPSSLGGYDSLNGYFNPENASFTSSITASMSNRRSCMQQLGTKMEMVYSLLSMLGARDKEDMSKTLLAMSASQDSCIAMRQSGCLPLLIQLLHGGDKDSVIGDKRGSTEARQRASQAMHNIVHAHPDDKRGRREARVLRLLELIREYCDNLRDVQILTDDDEKHNILLRTMDKHPGPSIAALMKLSFDEEHRHAMCQLGGLQAIAELIQVDYDVHGDTSNIQHVTLRRYAGMALTNLTFGDGTNKALLCSMKTFMHALISQLYSPNEDLRQVTASVLRNLSWRADLASKMTLREVGAVSTLMKAAIDAKKESTLKSVLSALWNLTAHCSKNKADICAVNGALAFLVNSLIYKSPSKTLNVVENGGGILRNISSHIAVHEEYRAILRNHNCLQILLQHLKSPSLTIVSNSCGTLWNLSARSTIDQNALLEMGAVSMLRNLVHSKHKMISMGSSAALKNLLASKPAGLAVCLDPSNKSNMPTLHVRKQKALEAELDQNLSETCDNIDSPKNSPTPKSDDEQKFTFNNDNGCHTGRLLDRQMVHGRMYHSIGPVPHFPLPNGGLRVPRSNSRDSLDSGRSDVLHDRHRSLELLTRSSKLLANENKRRQSASPAKQIYEGKLHHSQRDLFDNDVSEHDGMTSSNNDGSKYSSSEKNRSFDIGDDILEVYEQPIDYSLKYRDEEKNNPPKWKTQKSSTPKTKYNNYVSPNNSSQIVNGNSERSNLGEPCSNSYQESDSNEPDSTTNFSLRYTERNEPANNKKLSNNSYDHCYNGIYGKNSEQQDAVKTYFTEGTPLNFSNAVSMSDLNEIGNERMDCKHDNDANGQLSFNKNGDIKGAKYVKNVPGKDEKERQQSEDNTVSYCVEDTPACFSRVSSLSSLESNCEKSIDVPCPLRIRENVYDRTEDRRARVRDPSDGHISSKKHSLVSGNDVVNSAQETPMMFSRSSSLGSVDSCEQHSICEDRISVVSDFSGMATPSDVLDSISRRRSPVPISNTASDEKVSPTSHGGNSNKVEPTQRQSDGIFDDGTKTFALEETSGILSRARSPFSLSIDFDDEAPLSSQQLNIEKTSSSDNLLTNNSKDDTAAVSTMQLPTTEKLTNEERARQFSYTEKNSSLDDLSADNEDEQSSPSVEDPESGREETKETELSSLSDDNENEGDDILAAFISSAMPNNNKRGHHNNSKLSSKVNKLNNAVLTTPHASAMPAKTDNLRRQMISVCNDLPRKGPLVLPKSINSDQHNNNSLSCDELYIPEDALKVYNTENTPAMLSKAGSISDLSCCNEDQRLSRTNSSRSSVCDDNDNVVSESSKFNPSLSKTGIKYTVDVNSCNEITERNNDEKISNIVENTPICFSDNSSLSSLSNVSIDLNLEISKHDNTGASDQIIDPEEDGQRSRRSSIGSLSAESLGAEPTPSEQALLHECISSALPKSKLGSSRVKKSKLPRMNRNSGSSSSLKSRLPTKIDAHPKSLKFPSDSALDLAVDAPSSQPIIRPSFSENACNTPEDAKVDKQDIKSSLSLSFSKKSEVNGPAMHISAEKLGSEGSSSWTDESPNANELATLQAKLASMDIDVTNSKTSSPQISPDVNSASQLSSQSMTSSKMLRIEAGKVADDVEFEGGDVSVSCMSDLDLVNPPSLMADMSMSMCSSVTSDMSLSIQSSLSLVGKKKKRHLAVPMHRMLGANCDIMRSSGGSDLLENIRPPSNMGSIDNLSMRSSCTSEIINDINPPSIMDDVSIVSTVNRATEQTGGGRKYTNYYVPQSKVGQNNLIENCMKSSCNSEMLDNMKPPSCFQDISEVSADINSESHGDSTASDTEVEEELPHDDEESTSKTTDTSHETNSQRCTTALSVDDRCNTALSGDITHDEDGEIKIPPAETSDVKYDMEVMDEGVQEVDSGEQDEYLSEDGIDVIEESEAEPEITSEQIKFLEADANLVVCSLNEITEGLLVTADGKSVENLVNDTLIDDETISLVSIDSESEHSRKTADSSPIKETFLLKRPRIVKPVSRVNVKPESEVAAIQNVPKGIRGRRKTLIGSSRAYAAKNVQANVVRPSTVGPAIKMNKCTSLKSCQTQNSFQNKNSVRSNASSFACNFHNQNAKKKVLPNEQNTSTKTQQSRQLGKQIKEGNKPNPPVKQGTFTKDTSSKTEQRSPPMPLSNGSKTDTSKRNGFGSKIAVQRRPSQNISSGFSKNTSRPVPMKRSISNATAPGRPSMRQSPSTQSLKQQNNRRPIARSRTPSLTSLSSRSTTDSLKNSPSNASLQSVGSIADADTKSVAKKPVKSRIAGLWKKDDVSVKRTNPKKSDGCAQSSNNSKLSRSSTYEKIPELNGETKMSESKKPKPKAKVAGTTFKLKERKAWQSNTYSRPSVLYTPKSKRTFNKMEERKTDAKTVASNEPANDDSSELTLERHNSFVRIGKRECDGDPACSSDSDSTTDTIEKSAPTSAIVQPFNYTPSSQNVSKIPTPTASTNVVSSFSKRNETETNGAADGSIKRSLPKRFCLITSV